MPQEYIHHLEDRGRIPRIGIIRLGLQLEHPTKKYGRGHPKEGQPVTYPRATDYFVLRDAPGVAEIAGEKPTSIPIRFAFDNPLDCLPQMMKKYAAGGGLRCMGNGIRCFNRWESQGNATVQVIKDGAWCDQNYAARYRKETGYPFWKCPCGDADEDWHQTHNKRPAPCKPTGRLLFLVEGVPRLGVYQLTVHQRALVSMNKYLQMVIGLFGGLRGIPFDLNLVEDSAQIGGNLQRIYTPQLEIRQAFMASRFAGLMDRHADRLALGPREADAPALPQLPPARPPVIDEDEPLDYDPTLDIDPETGEILPPAEEAPLPKLDTSERPLAFNNPKSRRYMADGDAPKPNGNGDGKAPAAPPAMCSKSQNARIHALAHDLGWDEGQYHRVLNLIFRVGHATALTGAQAAEFIQRMEYDLSLQSGESEGPMATEETAPALDADGQPVFPAEMFPDGPPQWKPMWRALAASKGTSYAVVELVLKGLYGSKGERIPPWSEREQVWHDVCVTLDAPAQEPAAEAAAE